MTFAIEKDINVLWMQAELSQARKNVVEANMEKAVGEALESAETVASYGMEFCTYPVGLGQDADAVHKAVLKTRDQKVFIYASLFHSSLLFTIILTLCLIALQSLNSCLIMKPMLLLLLAFSNPLHASSSSSSSPAFASDSGSDTGYSSEWKVLTKHNFSTQIRIHPHILLLVTLPCK